MVGRSGDNHPAITVQRSECEANERVLSNNFGDMSGDHREADSRIFSGYGQVVGQFDARHVDKTDYAVRDNFSECF